MKCRTPVVLFSAAATAVIPSPRSLAAVFASQVVSYSAGTLSGGSQPYTDPNGAIGAPDPTTGNDFGFPNVLSPFSPAYDTNSGSSPYKPPQLAIVGEGGELTLRFPIPVKTSGTAPSIGVVSNAGLVDVDYPNGQNANPAFGFSGGASRVEVSKDGTTWFSLGNNIPFSNPANYFTDSGPFDSTPGTHVADFGKVFTGNLSSFDGEDWTATLATLNGSAGGNWLDLASSGLDEVRYIRFSIDPNADPNDDPFQQLPVDAVMLNDSLSDYSLLAAGDTLNLTLGTITLNSTNTTGGAMFNAGSLLVAGGTITTAGPSIFNAGTLNYTAGTITADVINGGVFRADPGAGQTLSLANTVRVGGSFGSVSLSSGTFDVETGTLLTTGVLAISAGSTLHKTGAGVFVVGGSQSHGAGAAFAVDAGTAIFNSDGGSNLAVIVAAGAAGQFNVAQNLAALASDGSSTFSSGTSTVGPVDGSGTLTVAAGASVTAAHVRMGTMAIGPGATLAIASFGAHSGTSSVASLSLDAAGTLDLKNNGIIVTDTTQFGAIQSAIQNAADGRAWDRPGITSSTAAAHSDDHAIGYALASTIGSTSFNGISFTDAVLARYTLIGDTNLKGSVDLSDYTKVVQNFGKSGAVWSDGNFDYSGTVGLGDYTKVVLAFGRTDSASLGNTAGPSAVQVKASAAAFTLRAAPAVISATDVTLTVNLATGNVTLISAVQSPTAVITAYTVKSPSGSLIKFKNSATKYLGVSFENNPNVFYTSSNSNQYHNWTGIKNTTTVIGEGFGNSYTATNDTTWTNYTLPSNGYALGKMFLQLSSGGVADLSFQWDDASLNTYTSLVNYVGGQVPEPGSVSLLAIGAVSLLNRRRRRLR